jgi:nitrogen fixation protein FixH
LVTVSLPSVQQTKVTGTVSFYRPSDAELDSKVKLGLDAVGRQSVSVRELRAGLWKVRVEWNAAGQDYFFEKPIIIKRLAAS